MSSARAADNRRRGLPTCVVADRDRDVLERLCDALRHAPVAIVGTAVDGDDALRLAARLRTSEIGKRLYLSPDTVKVHVTRARQKLGARTTTQAVAAALRRALIR